MSQSNALRATPPFQFIPEPAQRLVALRVLPSIHSSLGGEAGAQWQEQPWWQRVWFALAIALLCHLSVVVGLWHRGNTPVAPSHVQEIELLRNAPPPPQKVEPPPKIEPQRKPDPVKAETPRNVPPPAALRTEAAQAPVPNTMAVAENLTASRTSGPVEAVPTAPPAPKAEEPITEPNGFAGYLNNPPPAYPKAAQRLGMQGRVLLRVHVLANGQVAAVEVRQSSGKTLLDEAAMAAVRSWTFAPAKRGNTPVDAWTQVPIDFKLAS